MGKQLGSLEPGPKEQLLETPDGTAENQKNQSIDGDDRRRKERNTIGTTIAYIETRTCAVP